MVMKHAGALPQSAPTDGNVMTAANDIETRLGNQSSPVSVLPWTPASTIMPGGTVEVAPTAAAKLRAGTAAAAVGAAPGEESCLKEGFAGANGKCYRTLCHVCSALCQTLRR